MSTADSHFPDDNLPGGAEPTPGERNDAAQPMSHPTLSPTVQSDSVARARHRVLLVDDHPVTRQGMRAIIDQQLDFEVCAEAANAAQALQLAETAPPEIAVIDIALGAESGIELTRRIKARSPAIAILVVSMHEETAYAERALRAGAHGYMMKEDSADQLVAALRQLLRGEIFVGPRVRQRMAQRLAPKRHATAFPIDTLSDREWEVFTLLGDGYSTREVGERLKLSSKTIDSYREHLKEKLGLRSGAELVRHAIEWGRTRDSERSIAREVAPAA